MTLVVAAATVIGVSTPPAASADEPVSLLSSIATGGRLYDNWIREMAKRPPKERHPLYPAEANHADDPATTWRCVACHGWDYLGVNGAFRTGPDFTGITGIRGKAGAPLEDILVTLRDDRHGYMEHLDDEALMDLARFVSQGQIIAGDVIDPERRRARGEPRNSHVLFATVCVSCHGPDGTKMNELPPLGDETRDDPWKALHKMLNGHPGDEMPALRVFSLKTNVDLLSYLQSLPSRDMLMSVNRGGKLYDDWAREMGVEYPKGRHPAYPKSEKVAEGTSSWRCVECHGWDYKGAVGIRGIRKMAGAHPAAVLETLTDDVHRMDDHLKFSDLWDLASFVTRGQIEMNEFIEPRTKVARGKAELDNDYFFALCAVCHGDTGIDIRTMPAMGRVANDNPWKALHKTLHGHPGESMPAWQAAVPPRTIRNILAKLQTLPRKKR